MLFVKLASSRKSGRVDVRSGWVRHARTGVPIAVTKKRARTASHRGGAKERGWPRVRGGPAGRQWPQAEYGFRRRPYPFGTQPAAVDKEKFLQIRGGLRSEECVCSGAHTSLAPPAGMTGRGCRRGPPEGRQPGLQCAAARCGWPTLASAGAPCCAASPSRALRVVAFTSMRGGLVSVLRDGRTRRAPRPAPARPPGLLGRSAFGCLRRFPPPAVRLAAGPRRPRKPRTPTGQFSSRVDPAERGVLVGPQPTAPTACPGHGPPAPACTTPLPPQRLVRKVAATLETPTTNPYRLYGWFTFDTILKVANPYGHI